MILSMILVYFVICFVLFMSASIDSGGYLYFLHPSKYLEEYGARELLLLMSIVFLLIALFGFFGALTSRMKEIEYEYQAEKTEKRKHSIFEAIISQFWLSLLLCVTAIFLLLIEGELPKIMVVGMLFPTGLNILFTSKYRMKIFEYEYEAGKIEERKYKRKKRQRVSSIIWIILFSLLPLAGQLIHMSENGIFYQGCYFACVEEDSTNQDTANEKVCYITDVDALPFVTKIEIPETINGYRVVDMQGELFKRYKVLKNVTIPEGVRFIGAEVFSDCSSALYTEYEYGKYVGDSANPYAVLVGLTNDNMSTYEIHADTKIIANGVFQNCESLRSITIPDSVTTIGYMAFYGCGGLTSVTIGDSVTAIGASAFEYCNSFMSVYIYDVASWCNITFEDASIFTRWSYNLYLIKDGSPELITDLVIPDSVATIGDYAFYKCTNLASVTIPDSVTAIGENAFDACYSLTDVYYTGSESEWAQITIGSNNDSLTNATIHYNYIPEE